MLQVVIGLQVTVRTWSEGANRLRQVDRSGGVGVDVGVGVATGIEARSRRSYMPGC
jgi:hypothetical protein